MNPNNQLSLSSGQKGLWLLHQLDPISDRYNMPLTFTFANHIKTFELERLLTELLQRHDMLRSTFIEIDGKPVRKVNTVKQITIESHDFNKVNQKELINKIRSISSKPFNLSKGPLFRAAVLYDTPYGNVLLLTIHHMVFDGASLKIMFDELADMFESFSNKDEIQQSELKHNYNDFVDWQNQWLKSEESKDCRSYWKNQLSGDLPQLKLPVDRHLNNVDSVAGDFIKFPLPNSVVMPFKQLSQKFKCSEYVVWLTAYIAFLSRYTSQNDVVIGTPSMGRSDSKFDDVIGYFVNLIPLRCQLNPNESFIELLTRFKNDIYTGLMHADYPLSEIIKDLGDSDLRGDQPLFQSSFIWTVATALKANNDSNLGLNICPLVHESGEQNLSFEVLLTDETMFGLLKYRTQLFSRDTAEKIQNALLNFFESIVIEPESEIKLLSLISEEEEDFLFHELNSNAKPYPEDMCIHQLFEKQANLQPDITAVEFAGEKLTYGELNRQSNQLAHYLIELQPGENQALMGLCVERSMEMIIGILAILKAGFAYVPIDPDLPAKRRIHILQETGISVLLTQHHLLDLSTGYCKQQIILDMTQTHHKWSGHLSSNLELPTVNSDSLAYVIYTSGSTGLPKGVMQTHRTIVNLVHAQSIDESLSKPLRTLQFAPFNFDVSVQEISTCWMTGSPLILINKQQKSAIHQMSEWLSKLNIERMFVPPAVLNWLTEDWQKQAIELPGLKEIIVAGETLLVSSSLKKYLSDNPNCKLWNHYGPTETHVASIAAVDYNQIDGVKNIGFILPNLSAFILDQQQQVLPFGAVGELYIGGAGLATGYCKQPKLTEQRFIQNPFSYHDNELLYRTGDSVRYQHDGQLEFIGRLDNQVKIRGFRVELSEVEQQLNNSAFIQASVVTMIETVNHNNQLIAYVCSHPDNQLSETKLITEITAELQNSLPDYMIPDHFILVAEFPLTQNGKINRKALPLPDLQESKEKYVAPEGEFEIKMVDIWSSLLQIPAAKISSKANFFELGGHSLLVAQLINEVKHLFDIELTYQVVFSKNTLKKMSDVIELQMKTDALVKSLASTDDSIEEMEW